MGLPINRTAKVGGQVSAKTRMDQNKMQEQKGLNKAYKGLPWQWNESQKHPTQGTAWVSLTRPSRITGWMLPEGLNNTGRYQRHGGRKHEWLQGVGLLEKAIIRNKARRSYKPGQMLYTYWQRINCIWTYIWLNTWRPYQIVSATFLQN